MNKNLPFVVFKIDNQQFALECAAVRRIIQLVEIAPIPNMTSNILGVINVKGEITTVINIRHYLNLPPAEPNIEDLIIIAETLSKPFAFIVNEVIFTEFSMTSQSVSKENDTETAHEFLKSETGVINIINIKNLLKTNEYRL